MHDSVSRKPSEPSHPAASTDEKRQDHTKESVDPYEYVHEDGISHWGAIAHLLRASMGSGILVMPYTMKNLGYVNGALLMVGVSVLYFHTISTLLSIEYRMCKQFKVKSFSFIELTDKIFQMAPHPLNKLRAGVRYMMYFYYGSPMGNAAWLVVLGACLQNVARFFNKDVEISLVLTCLIIPLTVCCMFDRLFRILVPYSALTNCMSLIMVLIVVTCAILHPNTKPTLRAFGDVTFIPQGLALFVETLRCTAAILPLKNDMKHPRKMAGLTGVVNIIATTLTLFYLTFGLVCYGFHGDQVQDNILLNLPSNDFILLVVNVMYAAEMMVAFILTFYVYFLNIWTPENQEHFKDSKYKYVVEYCIRFGIIIFGYVTAVAAPNLGLISSIGGTFGIIVELALPSVMELLYVLTKKRKSCLLILKNVCIIAFSAGLVVLSTVSCVEQVIQLYSD